jgi:hypothetical protein
MTKPTSPTRTTSQRGGHYSFFSLTLLLLLVTMIGASAYPAPYDAAIHYWGLDDATSPALDSIGTIQLEFTGNYNAQEPGKLNYSVASGAPDFTGFSVSNITTGWTFSEEFATSFWINLSQDASDKNTYLPLFRFGDAAAGRRITLYHARDDAHLDAGSGDPQPLNDEYYAQIGSDGGQTEVFLGSGNLANNGWNFIFFQRKLYGGVYFCEIYQNNGLVGNTSCNSWSGGTSGDGISYMCDAGFVGFPCGSSITNMDGAIDSITLWNTSVSRADITTLYNSGAGLELGETPPNTAPSLSNITFSPVAPTEVQNAIASTTYTDPEAQTGSVRFLWYVNGTNVYNSTSASVTSGATATSTINAALYVYGDLVAVDGIPNDGTQDGSTETSSFSPTQYVAPVTPPVNTSDSHAFGFVMIMFGLGFVAVFATMFFKDSKYFSMIFTFILLAIVITLLMLL